MGLMREIKKAIHNGIRAYLSEYVETHTPCQVISYDATRNLVNLQPCINHMRTFDSRNMTTVQLPPINNVPVQLYGSGDLLTNLAPQAGSYGNLHVSKRKLDTWLTKGGIVDPSSVIMFDQSEGFFSPGLYVLVTDGENGKLQSAILTDRIGFRNRAGDAQVSLLDNDKVEIDADLVTINSTADAAALGSVSDTNFDDLVNLLCTWTPVPNDGGAALKAAALIQWPLGKTSLTSTASTKLKIDS